MQVKIKMFILFHFYRLTDRILLAENYIFHVKWQSLEGLLFKYLTIRKR